MHLWTGGTFHYFQELLERLHNVFSAHQVLRAIVALRIAF